MAMFHLSTKPISRKIGRSATASSAYRAGAKIEDKRTGLIHDYTKKKGVVNSDCFVFQDGGKIQIDRSQVWNTAEAKEKRKDSRTAREIIVNLPHELDDQQREKLLTEFVESVAKKYSVAIDWAIHRPDKQGDQRNHHAHVMMTTRKTSLDRKGNIILGDKTALELGNKDLVKLGLPTSQEQIKQLRADWATIANTHLELAGFDECIDHRSHAERGLQTLPTIKLGWQALAMERQGVQTEKGNYNRQVKTINQEIQSVCFDIGRLTAQQKLEQLRAEREKKPLSFMEKMQLKKQQEQPQAEPKPQIQESEPKEQSQKPLSFMEKMTEQRAERERQQELERQAQAERERQLAEIRRQQQAQEQPSQPSRDNSPRPF